MVNHVWQNSGRPGEQTALKQVVTRAAGCTVFEMSSVNRLLLKKKPCISENYLYCRQMCQSMAVS